MLTSKLIGPHGLVSPGGEPLQVFAAPGGGGAEVTGTPVAITWAGGDNPAGQSVTVPADATACYLLWTYFDGGTGNGLQSATLAGNAPDEVFEVPGGAATSAAGVAVWYDPPTGSQTLDVDWDATPSEGPTSSFVCTKGGNTTAARDIDGAAGTSTGAVSVTLTTQAGDLVLKHDMKFDTPAPSNTGGWTSLLTGSNNTEFFRLASIVAAGATQVCPSEDEDFSTIVAIAIPPT